MDRQLYTLLQNITPNYQFAPDEHYIVAFSGGPDSVFLTRILKECVPPSHITLVHFDHGLRNDSTNDAQTLQAWSLCDGMSVIVETLPVTEHATTKKISIETAGRDLRRTRLIEIAKKSGIRTVLLGHHLDDHIETFLHQLIRGSQSGLKGILNKRVVDDVQFVRPLLTIGKNEILNYLDSQNIPYLLDPSNADLQYTRNQIRHLLIPQIEALNPNFRSAISASISHIRETNDLINDEATRHTPAKPSISKTRLQDLPTPVAKRIVINMIESQIPNTAQIHRHTIETIFNCLQHKNAQVSLPGDFRAIITQTELHIAPPSKVTPI